MNQFPEPRCTICPAIYTPGATVGPPRLEPLTYGWHPTPARAMMCPACGATFTVEPSITCTERGKKGFV